jgi:hypothetical protein
VPIGLGVIVGITVGLITGIIVGLTTGTGVMIAGAGAVVTSYEVAFGYVPGL